MFGPFFQSIPNRFRICIWFFVNTFVIGKVTNIACVGDSITMGWGSVDSITTNYPTMMQNVISNANVEDVIVHNFAVPSMTMLKLPNISSYWVQPQYKSAIDTKSQIVIIMLGTNDAKKSIWNTSMFIENYIEMVQNFQSAAKPDVAEIFLCIPPPLYNPGIFDFNGSVINSLLPRKIIPLVAEMTHSKMIDVFSALGGANLSRPHLYYNSSQPRYLNDGLHPNDVGYEVILHAVMSSILHSHSTYISVDMKEKLVSSLRKRFRSKRTVIA